MRAQFITFLIFNIVVLTIFFRGTGISWFGAGGGLLILAAMNLALHPWYRREYVQKSGGMIASLVIMFLNIVACIGIFALHRWVGANIIAACVFLGALLVYNHRALYGSLITL